MTVCPACGESHAGHDYDGCAFYLIWECNGCVISWDGVDTRVWQQRQPTVL